MIHFAKGDLIFLHKHPLPTFQILDRMHEGKFTNKQNCKKLCLFVTCLFAWHNYIPRITERAEYIDDRIRCLPVEKRLQMLVYGGTFSSNV